MSTPFLSSNDLAFASFFPASTGSVINIRSTNPRDTDISTADTIALMTAHSASAQAHPLIKDACEAIRRGVAMPDHPSSIRELVSRTYDYVKQHVTFVEDEELLEQLFGIESGVELLIEPARLLSMRQPMGDCDDHSMLTKTLLTGVGVDSDFVTVAVDQENKSKWSHVYNVAYDWDGTPIPVDTSHGKYVGWEVQNATRKQVWGDISRQAQASKRGDMYIDNEGMGLVGDDGNTYSADGTLTSITPSGGGGYDWSNLLAPVIRAGSQIAVAQFGQPQLAPNTFIRGANGSLLTNQPVAGGFNNYLAPTPSGFGGIGSLVLIGAVALGALALFSRR